MGDYATRKGATARLFPGAFSVETRLLRGKGGRELTTGFLRSELALYDSLLSAENLRSGKRGVHVTSKEQKYMNKVTL